MAVGTFGKIILALVVLGGSAAAYSAVKSGSNSAKTQSKAQDMTQEEKVEYIADRMRDFQVLPGSASDAEINNWESQMKTIVNPDNQRVALCKLYSMEAISLATVERVSRQMGDQEMIASVQDDIANLPPGSLKDWLFRTARGSANSAAYVNNECQQQPMVVILNPDVRRNSNEMRETQ